MTRHVDGELLTVMDDGGTVVLKVRETMGEDGSMVFAVGGGIRGEAAPEFEDELLTALTCAPFVEVDFGALEHISAPGLQALLSAQRLMDEGRCRFALTHLGDAVRETFEKTGFIDLIEIRE
ncbi:MAG: STAS domain-containing protein [Lachnospiraceae bacterium]|nr:STAS domain-containing protein [Lachnospiraceae bacterium]